MRRASFTAILFFIGVAAALAQEITLPFDPLSGRLVFEAKGCLGCHSLGGYGGALGPDFAKDQFFGGASELSAVLWNHIPDMNRQYRKLGLTRPSLSESDMMQLMGFLYYLRYIGEPGSALRGKALLDEKGCNVCHGDSDGGYSGAPRFREIERELSPVNLVQAMWNHGPAMQEETEARGMEYPLLGPDDIGDISAFLQLAAQGEVRIRMPLGNPNRGKEVFATKRCTACHSVDGKKRKTGPDLYARDLKMSVTEIAGLMWNHGPLMREFMETEHVEWPELAGHEMADLVAYLYFLGFQDEPGSATAGRSVFDKKGCVGCHESNNTSGASDLTTIRRSSSVIGLVTRMWNHAEEMEDLALTRNMEWPEMSGEEMQDLFGYLHAHMKTGE